MNKKGLASFAKISRPSATGIIPRKRLFRLLRDGEKPVTWVTGPAGSGKTSLVAGYLDFRKIPCLWYQMDESDADTASFFYYLGLAAKKAAPRYRNPLPLLTPEYLQGLSTFSRRFFENLYARLKPPFAIVFDNYQEAPEQSPLQDMVNIGLSLIPDGVQVFVIGRKDLLPQFTRLRANNTIQIVGWDELRFTFEEAKQFIGRKEKLPKDAVAALHAKTEGWAAGLVLLTERAGTKTLEPGASGNLQPHVFDYFAGEVFDKLNTETRDFLLATAFLPAMTVRTAEKMTRRKDAGGILAALNRSNFFTEKISGPAPAYRFHPLFRAFLQARVTESLSRKNVASLREKTAQLLIEEGQIEDAAALLYLAEDWVRLVQLVLENAQSLIMQGRNRTLKEWIAKVPAEVTAGNPWLLYWSGVCGAPFDPIGSRALFERALPLFEAQGNETGALLAWSSIIPTFLFEFHDFRPLDRWIEWIEPRIRHGLCFSTEVEAGVVAGMTGIMALRRPDLPDRQEWLERALHLPQKRQNIDTCIQALANSMLFNFWTGEFTQCGILMQEMKNMVQSHSLSPMRLISVKLVESLFYITSADFDGRAVQSVSEGLRLAQENGVHVISATFLIHGAIGSLNEGDAKSARDFLRKAESAVGGMRINASHYYCVAAWCELIAGNAARSVGFAKRSVRLIEAVCSPFAETASRLALTHSLYASGEHHEAREQLNILSDIVSRTGSSYLKYLCCLTEAHFTFDRNDRPSGIEALRTAMETGRKKGFTTMVYFWRPSIMSRLCGEAIEAGIEVEYAQRLITKLGLAADERFVNSDNWPWRLKVITLGSFGLIRDGKPVVISGKAQKKPLQMLKAVIASGPQGVRKDHLIDALWPNSEGDTGNIAFHTTLSRLRSLVGDEKCIQFNEGILSLDRRYSQVDAWAFEGLLERIESIRNDDGSKDNRDSDLKLQADKAIDLYKGIFLPADQDLLPSVSARERLRSKFLRLISRTGQALEHSGDFEAALDYYIRGLESDPLAEGLHQGLISCYLRLGRKAEAITAYNRCKTILLAELGVEPSPDTELKKQQFFDK